jgi:hypothetical protein
MIKNSGTPAQLDDMTSKQKFVFIVGAPRSGTTLLSLKLETNLGIAIPLETHFIPLFHRWLFLWRDLEVYKSRKLLIECIYDFLEIWTPRAMKGRDLSKARKFSLLVTKDKFETILNESHSYTDVVINLFKEYSLIYDKKRWGEKSAFYSHIPLERLIKTVPNAKVIHIIRDGRDVCLSWQRIWSGPKTTIEAAKLWVEHVVKKQQWGRKNPECYCEIRYEDLIDDPKLILNSIANFLGISQNPNNLTFHDHALANILSIGGPHPMISMPIDSQNKYKWKTHMSHSDRIIFEKIAGRTLEKLGYEVDKTSMRSKENIPVSKIIEATAKPFFSKVHILRSVRPILPLIIYLFNRCNIQLSKLIN